MALTPEEKTRIEAEYKAWLKTDEYKEAKFTAAADTPQGRQDRAVALGMYLNAKGKDTDPAFQKGAETLAAVVEVIEKNEKGKGFIDTVLGFLGKNKFGLGAAMLALIGGNALGLGMLGTIALTGVALAAGSAVGDKNGIFSALTGGDKVKAPTAAIFKAKDTKSLPKMQELIEIGEVKTEHDYEHKAALVTLKDTDISPSNDVDHMAVLHIQNKDITVYGKENGSKFDVKYIQLGKTADGNKLVMSEMTDDTGSISLDVQGDDIVLTTETAQQLRKAHNALIASTASKAQEAAKEITVQQGKPIPALEAGKGYILNITDADSKVVARVGGTVTDDGKEFVADSSTGLVEGTKVNELKDPKAALKSFNKHVRIPLDGTTSVDAMVKQVQIANQVNLREDRKVTVTDIKVEGVTAGKALEADQAITLSANYKTGVERNIMAGQFSQVENPQRDFKVTGKVAIEGADDKKKQFLIIPEGTQITGPDLAAAGIAGHKTTQEIKVDVTGLELDKAAAHTELQTRLMNNPEFVEEIKKVKTKDGVHIATNSPNLPDIRGDLAAPNTGMPLV